MAQTPSGKDGKPPPQAPARTSTGAFLAPVDPGTFRRENLASSFGDDEGRRRMDSLIGGGQRSPLADAPPPPLPTGVTFDGLTPAPGMDARESWRALNAPVQGREGHRSPAVYSQAILQFAVGSNPRYDPDAPEKPRAHLFLWDVTRALGAEIPRFVGPLELNLAQTCDWIRHEGPMRGWRRVDPRQAREAAGAGMPVVLMPRDIKLKLLAVLLPGLGPDGHPRVSAAAKKRGNGLTVYEALGTVGVEAFLHA
jgi:hypothetical protein